MPEQEGPAPLEILIGNTITATVELPARRAPKPLLLRLRHPRAAPLRSVEVNGAKWDRFDQETETIHLEGLKGRVRLQANY